MIYQIFEVPCCHSVVFVMASDEKEARNYLRAFYAYPNGMTSDYWEAMEEEGYLKHIGTAKLEIDVTLKETKEIVVFDDYIIAFGPTVNGD